MDITQTHVQTLLKIYAGERLNLSQFTISSKLFSFISFIFLLWPVHTEKKERNVFRVKQVVFESRCLK